MPASTRDEAIAIIEKSALSPYADTIIPLLKPSIKMDILKGEVTTKSYFGGIPVLPEGFEWPHWDGTRFAAEGRQEIIDSRKRRDPEGSWDESETMYDSLLQYPLRPLSFIAQIYLPDLPYAPELPTCPRQGMLYFFREACVAPPCWEPTSRGSVQVIHIPDADLEKLTPTPPPDELILMQPLGEDYINHRAMSFSLRWHLPPDIESLPNETTQTYNFLLALELDQTGASHLFGYTFFLDAPDRLWYTSREFNPLPTTGPDDWQVLLQLRDDYDLDFSAGNTNTFTITIRTSDLGKGDFSNIWFDF